MLASAGLAIGLWLFWPGGLVHQLGSEQAAHQAGEQAGAAQAAIPPDEPVGSGLLTLSVAQASVSMSAKQALGGRLAEPRLQQVARAMPEIGLPDSSFDASAVTDPPGAASNSPLPAAATPALTPSPAGKAVVPDEAIERTPGELAALGVGAEAPAKLPPAVAPTRPVAPRATPAVLPSVTPRSVAPQGSGVPQWVRNAAAAPAAGDQRPMIAIVIDDLGPSAKRTFAVADLRAPLTLAFLPYAGGLAEQTAAAREAGHELMIHMPMEPEGSEAPGPGALLVSLSDAEFHERLLKNLDVFDGAVGLNNHMGSRLTRDSERMSLVMAELRRRDLLFVDSRTTPKSVGPVEALRHGVPFAARDVFLDNEPNLAAVLRQLERVELLARRKGVAIGIGHPNDATLQALRRWLPTLPQRGFRLVPVSSIVARNSCVEPDVIAGCGTIREPAPSQAVASQSSSPRS